MPNNKGGKNYKKSKNNVEDSAILYEKMDDQMYGRVTKVLGNCNLMVYCNDNKERLCHIRGSMRKKCWISVGDIVLISVRDFSDGTCHNEISKGDISKGDISKGDICAKYDPRIIYKLRQKDKSINPLLFVNIEKNEDNGKEKIGPVLEDGFIFDNDNDNEAGVAGVSGIDENNSSDCDTNSPLVASGAATGAGGATGVAGAAIENMAVRKRKYNFKPSEVDDDDSFNIDDI